jgi:5-methylcytosine-specific restriction endonuclease McrA
MNLKHLTDESLHNGAQKFALAEQNALINLLHHLLEIDRRRLFSTFKCGSLFDYVVSELNYPEDRAVRRISVMRLLRDVPEIEKKVTDGDLSLTNIVMAQTLFAKERKAGNEYTSEQKIEVLNRLENQSTREAKKIIREINPELSQKPPVLDFNAIEDEELRAKLLRVKGKYAHTNPNMTLTELLHMMCDNEIAEQVKSPAAPRVNSEAHAKRTVWNRDNGTCINCSSTYAVQIEHRIPQAKGGQSTVENMCVLCRSCNQRRAIEEHGIEKMSQFLKEPIVLYSADDPAQSSAKYSMAIH